MTPSEAMTVLTKIALTDGRQVDEVSARLWADYLPDVDYRDAMAYLWDYYRAAASDKRHWVLPGDVLQGSRKVRVQREAAESAALIEACPHCDVAGWVETPDGEARCSHSAVVVAELQHPS